MVIAPGIGSRGSAITRTQHAVVAALSAGLLQRGRIPNDRYGTFVISVASAFYLVQIAAEYRYKFMKHCLGAHDIYEFNGSWSAQQGWLSTDIVKLF